MLWMRCEVSCSGCARWLASQQQQQLLGGCAWWHAAAYIGIGMHAIRSLSDRRMNSCVTD
jgi:hypothetical protein